MAITTLIALGSNLGDPVLNIVNATHAIEIETGSVTALSSIWGSQPEGFVDDVPVFGNAVIAVETALSVLELMKKLQQIETAMGRPKKIGSDYQSRTIDLDVIDYGGQIILEHDLIVPHPRAHLRQFVLKPLIEINPKFQFSDRQESLQELLLTAPDNDMQVLLAAALWSERRDRER